MNTPYNGYFAWRRVLAIGISACAAASLGSVAADANIPPGGIDSSGNRFLVVDCLLPGELRKLGGQMTYLAPRRPLRSTASECEIRGGEYTAYDRANFATSLQVWLPKAQDGDAQAQNHVGEIFEKGMGQPADPAKAAEWYQKAAKQGYRQAMTNLAYLYEKGIGVGADPVRALNLYRSAAGITDDQLTFASEVSALREQSQTQIDALAVQLEQQTHDADQLREALSATQQQLHERRVALASARRDATQLRNQLADVQNREPGQSAARAANLQQLENELKTREAHIAQQQGEVDALDAAAAQRTRTLDAQIAAASAQDDTLRTELGKKNAEITSTRAALAAAGERVTATNQRVTQLTLELEQERAQLSVERARFARDAGSAATTGKDANEQLRKALAERELDIERQRTQIDALKTQARQYEEQFSQLKSSDAQRAAMQGQQQDQSAADVKNVRAELASNNQRLLETQQKLADATAQLDAERLRYAADQEQIARQRSQASTEQTKEIQRLADESAKREAEIIEQRARIAALEAERSEYAEQVAKLKPEAARVAMRGTSSEEAEPAAPPVLNVPKNFNAGNYYALIIGNNAYQYMPSLDTAIHDAHSVEKVLKERYGFKTKVLENATRGEILSALNDYRTSLKETDNLLIYYAGHGELDAKNLRGYWLPTNARRDDATEWISDQMITDQIGLMSARHVLVVADSCYSGAMTRSAGVRLITNGGTDAQLRRLNTLSKLPSRTVLTSGGEKPVLDGGGGGNSIFAHALIDVLMRNDHVLEGSGLWNQLFDPVKRAAARFKVDQSPRYSTLPDAGHLNGEFLFVPVAVNASAESRAKATPSSSHA